MTTAELGFKIDSSQASAATRELDKLSASSAKAETAAQKLGLSFKTSGVQAADLLSNTNLSEKARARLAEQLQKQGIATDAVTVASEKLQKGQKAALDGVMSMAGGVKGLTEEHEKGEGAANRFINTLTRRFVFGFIVSQLRQMVSAIADLNRELAKTGDVGNITGLGGQQIQGLQSAAARQGIASAQFLDDMLKFNQQIPLAKAGVGELGQLFRANRVNVADTSDAFFKLADLIKNAKDDTARLSILQQAGLPATREMVNFMAQGADAIKKQAQEAAKLTDQQLADAKKLEERWNTMWDNFTRFGKKAIVDISTDMDSLGASITNFYLKINPNIANALTANQKGTQLSQGDADKFYDLVGIGRSAPLPTPRPTVDEATRKTIESERISRAQQYLGILGQTTTAEEARRAVQLQLDALANNHIGIDKARAETLKRLAEEQNLGIAAIKQSADAYRVEAETVGMNVGEAAKYAAIQNAINEAKRQGKELTQGNIDAITREAEALGRAAQNADNMKFAYDTVKGAVSTFMSELRNGATVWQAFGKAAENALNKIADKLIEMQLNNLWQAAFPQGGGGGGFLQSILGAIGGGGKFAGPVGQTAVVGPMPSALGNVFMNGSAIHAFARGGIVSRPTLFPMANGAGLMGEAGPEAIIPLTRGPGGKLGVTSFGSGGINFKVNVVNNAGADVGVGQPQSDGQGGFNLEIMIDKAVAKNMAMPGSDTSNMLRSRGAVPPLTRR